MKVVRILIGLLFALGALFAGGCALAFGIPALMEGPEGMLAFLTLPALGLATAWGLGWLALRFLKGPVAPPPDRT